MRGKLESYFEFARLGASWRTEILAGATTFITMAYIVFVNPSILGEAGMPVGAVTAATCLSAALGSILMGAVARYPIALAPGMGLNAYFTYVVVKGLGVSWQVALGAVFLSGVAFLLLTLTGLRQKIVEAMPADLYAAVAVGIGLFIAFIGLKNAGIIVPDPATIVRLGNLREPTTVLAICGLLLIGALLAWRVRAAMLLGILGTSLLGAIFGLTQWSWQPSYLPQLGQSAFQLDVRGALGLGLLEIVFVFLFVDLFDNLGTLVAVTKKAGLLDNQQKIPRVGRILLCDSIATMFGSLLGTSTVVSYIESASGVLAGGRTGVTAIVTGLLFLVALFAAPIVGVIPAAATAPALILVGSMMMSHAAEIRWDDAEVAIPAFLTILAIPLSFSIANGVAFGFVAYTLLKLAQGKWQEVGWLVYGLTALFIARFFYLSGG
ncbi:NCS2 family permease [Bryobacter aggregatus]|uniref:NCS2 family permease n=1 Tax=Bryobacter aggregatus TaxID=360054 RepID=UPI0004E0F058|nr:NCS2 family permease [Bryobacter aggregatus]